MDFTGDAGGEYVLSNINGGPPTLEINALEFDHEEANRPA